MQNSLKDTSTLQKRSFSDRFSLEKFVPVIFVFSIGLVILVAIFSYMSVKEFQNSRSWVTHSYNVKETIFQIYYELANVKELERFAVEKDKRTVKNLSDAKARLESYIPSIEKKVRNLNDLVTLNASQSFRTQRIDSLIQYRLNYAAILIDEASKKNPNEIKISQWSNESSNLRVTMLAIREEMLTEEDHLLSARTDELQEKVLQTEGFIIVSTIVGFIIIIFSVYITRRLFNSRHEALELLKQSNKDLESKVELRTKDLLILRNRFKTLFDSEMAGIAIIDPERCIVESNQAFLSMIGFPESELPLNWENIEINEVEDINKDLRNVLNEKGFLEPYQTQIRKIDGTIIDILIGATLLKEEYGKRLIFVLDISESVRISNALAEREKNLTLITDAFPAMATFIDRGYNYRFVNSTYEKWFDVKKENVIGHNLEVLHGERFIKIKDLMDRAFEGETVIYEQTLDTKIDSKIIQGHLIPNVLSSGEIDGIFSMTIDITTLKEQEAALKEREKRLTLITDAIPALISYVDNSEVYRFTNVVYDNWFGLKKEDVVGMSIRELIKESYPNFYPYVQKALNGEIVKYETNLETRLGPKIVQGNLIPNVDENGDIAGFYSMTMDITTLKQQDAELKEREKELILITDTIPALISYIDKDLIYRFANGLYKSWFGLEKTEVIGKSLPEIIGKENYENASDYVRKALNGETVYFEETISTITGQRKIQGNLIPNIGEDGKVKGFYSMTLDVTLIKQQEETLKENEKQLTILTNTLPALVAYVDKDLVYKYANIQYKNWFGLDNTDIIGKRTAEIHGADILNETSDLIDRALHGETVEYEYNTKTLEGLKIIKGNLIPNLSDSGEIQGFYTMSFDISDIKKHEVAIAEREERFRLLAENASVMIWMTDKKSKYIYFNKTWLQFTGKSIEEELETGWQSGIHPSDLNIFIENFEKARKKGETFEIEFRLKHNNSEYCWIYMKAVPRFEGDDFVGYIGSGYDINERKKAHSYLNMQYNISRGLSDSESLNEAYERVLKTIVEGVGWDSGIIWIDDKMGNYLLSKISYSKDPENIKGLKNSVPVKSSLLSSKVFATKNPIWVTDLKASHNYEFEDKESIVFNSAFAFPIISNNKVLAIIECFSKETVEPINDLLEMLYSTGRQIGTFIEKKHTELLLRKAYDELEEKVLIRTNDLNRTVEQLKEEIEQRLKIEKEIEILAHTIKSTNDIIWITDLSSKLLFVNKAFEETYGYKESELKGKNISTIRVADFPAELTMEITKETMKGGWQGELLNRTKDGKVFPVRVSTSIVKDAEDKPRAIVGIAVDITDFKKKEETIAVQSAKLQLMQDITVVANKTFNINEALSFAIDKICQAIGWDIGHAYIVDKENLLRSTKIWNTGIDDKFKDFKFISENIHFGLNEGIPGHARFTGKSIWIEDVNSNNLSIRKKYFDEAGIQSGLAFPVYIEDEVNGILEFYSKEKKPVNSAYLESFDNIGSQLGRVLERKIALDNIVTSESKFRAVSETAHEGILILDKNDKIYFINESIIQNFGYQKKELIGEPLSKIIDFKAHNSANKYEGITNVAADEVSGFKKDGSEFPLEISSSVWYDKKEKYTTFILRNISERKKAEEIVKNSEKLLREAQMIAHVGSWTWNLETGKREYSDELKYIYGFKPKDDVSEADLMSRIRENDKKDALRILEESVKKKIPHNYTQRVIMPSGEMKILSCRGNVVVDNDGVVRRVYGTVQDITEISIKEQELILSNKKLKEAQAELVHNEKLAVLGRFSSGIAHEIRNPLANISALAQLLLKAPLDEKMKKHLSYIMINTDIANNIIKDLLNYASPDFNEFKKVNFNSLLDKIKNMVKPRCEKANVELITEFEKNIPYVYVDEKKLESAFFNFISNAIEAMEEGGKLEFLSKFNNTTNEIIVNFIDTGIGISQINMDKILEPFFTTKDTGTGLGMALASQTIKIHNGSLNISSFPGEGTNVEVRLPVNKI
ncbi:hypothetical protein BH10BAC5_BH10BAC5_26210 [soil metagenome]